MTDLRNSTNVFTAREQEREKLYSLLVKQERANVVAICGMPGVGKSWLVDHFFIAHSENFPGGYQRLALNAESPSSGQLLLADLAQRLDIEVTEKLLHEHLRHRLLQPRTLVHIENADSDEAVRWVMQFCDALAGCPIVVTGRVETLGTEQHWHRISLKPFEGEEALNQLQGEITWLKSIPLSEADAKKVVKSLGGLPLAIHFAAGYLAEGFGVDAFLKELESTRHNLSPIDSGDDLLSRDEARAVLHTTFHISLNLLERVAKKRSIYKVDKLFWNLSFAPLSGFSLSMATSLLAMDDDQLCLSLLKLAQQLSLLEPIADKPQHWQLHPLLATYMRQYAPNPSAVEARLHQWFLQRLPEPNYGVIQSETRHNWHELNEEQLALTEWLGSVPPALQATVQRAGSRYAIRNGPYYHWQIFFQKALENPDHDEQQRSKLLFILIQVAHKAGEIDKALGWAHQKYQLDQQREQPREAVQAKGQIADILQARGNLDEALHIRTQDQLPVYESLGDVRSIAITKGQIADILQARGKLDEALRIRTEDQLPVYQLLGDVREIAITKGKIADILQARGKLDQALRIREEEQLPVYKSLGDVRSIAITKGQIADILQARGNLDEALRIREEEQLPVYESLGDVREIAITKGQIADILQARGNLDEALRIREEEQLPVYKSLGDVREIAITKGQIADILQARGNLDEALRIREEDQLPAYESLGDVRSIAITKGKIADILQARGNLDGALRIRTEEELPVYESLGDVRSIAITKGQIADILQARGNLDEALRIRQQEQLPAYESLGDVRSIAINKGQIADILQARGNLDEALRIRQQDELPVYESLGDVRSIAIAKGKIADILQARGNLDEALRIRQQDELPVYESLGDVRSIAITKGKIADILQARGNLDEALRIRQQEQLPVYESLGDVREIAITKGQIADILFLNGEHDEASSIYENDVLPVYERLSDKRMLIVGQTNLAIMYLKTGKNPERGFELLSFALESAREMEIPEASQIEVILKQATASNKKSQ